MVRGESNLYTSMSLHQPCFNPRLPMRQADRAFSCLSMLTQQELYFSLHLFEWNALSATCIAICNTARNFFVPCACHSVGRIVKLTLQAVQKPGHQCTALTLWQGKDFGLKVFEFDIHHFPFNKALCSELNASSPAALTAVRPISYASSIGVKQRGASGSEICMRALGLAALNQ